MELDYRKLMAPALKRLEQAGGELTFDDLLDALAGDLGLHEDVRVQHVGSSNETALANSLRWALSYLSAEDKVRVSADGMLVSLTATRGFRETQEAFRLASAGPTEAMQPMAAGTTGNVELAQVVAQANRRLKRELLGYIHAREPAFFEHLIIDVLLAIGYGNGQVALSKRLGGRGDGGVDGVIFQDELGLDYFYVQAKRYKPSTTVPLSAVRDFAGSLEAHKARKGVFVTTGFLPASAHKFVEAIPRRITLLDGDALAGLMIRHNVGVKPEPVWAVKELDPAYFAA